MTPRVYVERPITSVEDAAALPDDAILFDGDIADGDIYYHDRDSGEWYVDGYPGTLSRAIQFECTVTALVPVEAKEETLYAYAVRDDLVGDEKVHRLVTRWEKIGT